MSSNVIQFPRHMVALNSRSLARALGVTADRLVLDKVYADIAAHANEWREVPQMLSDDISQAIRVITEDGVCALSRGWDQCYGCGVMVYRASQARFVEDVINEDGETETAVFCSAECLHDLLLGVADEDPPPPSAA